MAEPGRESDVPRAQARPRPWWMPSLIWLVPGVAVVICAWLFVNNVVERGPTITISFATGEGIEPGKTRIKYKNVDIGVVTRTGFSEDRSRVIVTAQISREAKGFLVEDTRFWVVRPRIAGASVSGLGTLLSGAYIGMDIGKSGKSQRAFEGLEVPPVLTSGMAGREFVLHGEDIGSLDYGSPVYFRRIRVGQVTTYDADPDGQGVTVKVFINAPYDHYVTANTRFWHASGIDIAVDANGVKINTESLVTVLVGGLAFQTPPESNPGAGALPEASPDTVLTLFDDRETALRNPDVVAEQYVMYFNASVRGLSVGSPVDFRGITLGEVTSIDPSFNRDRRDFDMRVAIQIYPERLRPKGRPVNPDIARLSRRELMDLSVARGLRAQLRTGNLITGQLYVALDFFPKAPKAKIDWGGKPPELPTVQGGLQELQSLVMSIAQKLDKVPFDTLGKDLDGTLKNADLLLQQLRTETAPQVTATLKQAQDTLDEVKRMLSPGSSFRQDTGDTLREVSRAARSFRELADYLERHPEALLRGKPRERAPDTVPEPTPDTAPAAPATPPVTAPSP